MNPSTNVIEYKCPCCTAGLYFGAEEQKLTCEYCGNTFELDEVIAFNHREAEKSQTEVNKNSSAQTAGQSSPADTFNLFICPSCSGEILADNTTAATFCPYCDNPTVMPKRLSGGFSPDAIIPFETTKEDAKAAFLKLCQGKPLLPSIFTTQNRLDRITGIYVPFWLYDCNVAFSGNYQATKLHCWSDSKYNYTRTDHFMLKRGADASFNGIPMDASSKMDDATMESIEPFQYDGMKEFNMAYLSGFYADRYDVSAENGKDRIRERINQSVKDKIHQSMIGYATTIPTSEQLNVTNSTSKYVLLPVWILTTRFKDKLYTFAMNGQTGKMTGSFPICPKKTAIWFSGIFAAATAIAFFCQLIVR